MLKLSALVREQHIRFPDGPFYLQFTRDNHYPPIEASVPIYVEELLRRWPAGPDEQIDRVLCNIGRLSKGYGHHVEGADHCILLAVDREGAVFTRVALNERGYTRDGRSNLLELTARGWARYGELTRIAGSPSATVFVAMWFGDETTRQAMNALYDKAIGPAIEQAGYRPTRSDREEHLGFIMDKILGDIKAAPFIVADFTGNRHGVYFEAGYARGLGKDVIHCCHAKQMGELHFDVKQVNCIDWRSPEDLSERLFQRIRATQPAGPYLTEGDG